MLLDHVRKRHRAMIELVQHPPVGIDPDVLRSALLEDFTPPLQLATSDDFESMQHASQQLQRVGLAACIFDDSNAWLRLWETIRARLGRPRTIPGHPFHGDVTVVGSEDNSRPSRISGESAVDRVRKI